MVRFDLALCRGSRSACFDLSGISQKRRLSTGSVKSIPVSPKSEEPIAGVDICALFSMEMPEAVEGSDKRGTLNAFKDEPSELETGTRESGEEAGRIGVGAIRGN